MKPLHPSPPLIALLVALSGLAAVRAAEPNAFLNLSSRGRVDRGENVLIGGLVLERTANVLIRGAGPSLAEAGVNEPVPHPRLTLHDRNGNVMATNVGWRAAIPAWDDGGGAQPYDPATGPVEAVERVMARTGAFAFTTDDDAALYVELPAGLYTVHLGANDDVPGVGLLEAYLVTEDMDPFAPAWRVRQDPENGYTPDRAGLAPIAVVDEVSGRTLQLTFDSTFTWNLPPGSTPSSHSADSLEITWVSTGTPDLRHGRAGVTDSRVWLTAPRYTKTGPNTAAVACLTTVDAAGTVIREEAILTFTDVGRGTFTYQWGPDDTANDRIGTVAGQAQGTFRWARQPENGGGTAVQTSRFFRVWPRVFADERPAAIWAVGIDDLGPVLRHGDGPDESDVNGAREAIVTWTGTEYVLHYDGCGTVGWRACQARSDDLINWEKTGPILQLGPANADDSGCACSPWMVERNGTWHMFYFASPNRTPAPDLIPTFPYLTRKAQAPSPLGPWTKQPDIIPFNVTPGTYYTHAAAPGHVMSFGGEYLQFFSATEHPASSPVPLRTLGLARTTDLDAAWTIDAQPLLPKTEQIENSSLYFEPTNGLWFLFTNHVAYTAAQGEFTDAVWMYWSPDPRQWSESSKAIVVDASSSTWSKAVIGMPSVVPIGNNLAVFYDGNDRGDFGHMRRDIGLALLSLPLAPPGL